MSGIQGKLAKFWLDNKVVVVMGGLLVGAHAGWRWMQDQEEFVPKGEAKQYPWIEIARHIKTASNADPAPAPPAEK